MSDDRFKKIPKRNGKFRLIYVPTAHEKWRCRAALCWLHRAAQKICAAEVVHGFAELRSAVTNAQRHVNKQFTVSFDLEDFFHHVAYSDFVEAIHNYTDPETIKLCNKFGRKLFRELPKDKTEAPDTKKRFVAVQGLPSSPVVANITFAKVDYEILELIPKSVVYTRYADDLSFSTNSPDDIPILLALIPNITAAAGFPINQSKTSVQCAAAGVRHITGVGVDECGVRPTRESKRKLRAALHNQAKSPTKRKANKAAGLAEWCKLRLPNTGHRTITRIHKRFKRRFAELTHHVAARTDLKND